MIHDYYRCNFLLLLLMNYHSIAAVRSLFPKLQLVLSLYPHACVWLKINPFIFSGLSERKKMQLKQNQFANEKQTN